MRVQQGMDVLGTQSWLDRPAQALQQVIKQIYASAGPAGRQVKNALYGSWAGHPLHPALTDIPIGAWTATFALDTLHLLTGSKMAARGADLTNLIGVAGATGAIAAGFTDWQHTYARARRIGLTHAVLNVSNTLAQTGSAVLRLFGARRAAQVISALVYSSLLVSAYLGGEMVENERIGVNRTSGQTPPPDFIPVLPEAELPEGAMRRVETPNMPVLLVRRQGLVYALPATCTHQSGHLDQGRLEGDSVICPLHQSQFSLKDGHVINGPASFPERCLSTRVRNGQIEVAAGRLIGQCRHEPAQPGAPREGLPQEQAETMPTGLMR